MEIKDILLCITVSFFVLMGLKLVLKETSFKEHKRNVLETPFPEPLNSENQQVHIHNWAAEDSLESRVIRKMIKETHTMCPIMKQKTRYTVCIQDPETNQGYILSVCCPHCVRLIQTSLKNQEGIYSFRKVNHVTKFYVKNEPLQVAIPCNSLNIREVLKIANTSLL